MENRSNQIEEEVHEHMYICNPINMEYKYQFLEQMGRVMTFRESADPSMVIFKEKYYLFPSMTAGFLVSDNLTDWAFHSLKGLPIHDYAPDVRVIGDYLYFSASHISKNCSFSERLIRLTVPLKKSREHSLSGTRIFSSMTMTEFISIGDAQIKHLSMGLS